MKLNVLLGVVVLAAGLSVQQASAFSVGGVELPKAEDLGIKLPDFQTASVADLSAVATKALSGLQSVAKSSPEAIKEIKAVQTALTGGDAKTALSSLADLGGLVKNIPGSAKLLETSKQVVSAWALKKGFDTSKISGLLGALQKSDTSALTSSASKLLGSGGLSDDQTGLVKGVLNTFGIDSSSIAGAASGIKGLFGK